MFFEIHANCIKIQLVHCLRKIDYYHEDIIDTSWSALAFVML